MITTNITLSSGYRQDNISLRDAMTMELAERSRVWCAPGLHVKLEGAFACIPVNATVTQTIVVKGEALSLLGGDMFVGVMWKSEENENIQCPKELKLTWEMVQKKFPELLDVMGVLCAFSV